MQLTCNIPASCYEHGVPQKALEQATSNCLNLNLCRLGWPCSSLNNEYPKHVVKFPAQLEYRSPAVFTVHRRVLDQFATVHKVLGRSQILAAAHVGTTSENARLAHLLFKVTSWWTCSRRQQECATNLRKPNDPRIANELAVGDPEIKA